jgi:hypothetical protein
MDTFLNLTQWPAMIITLVAAWLVASQTQHKPSWGFWRFLVGNVLWVVLGWHAPLTRTLPYNLACARLMYAAHEE